ncbi:hypothetical protein INT45_002718 [Circinella minor]|uniref:Uncharacterized protein n=1 Tax=Circinella minor TaxID=1195481 RepID=A0A8H7S2X2_9FUNG|nr:hypothetical protein INT45_002718 [Circinella minor]
MEQNINDGSSERVYTQDEMENIIRTIVSKIDDEKEARLSGLPIPVEISKAMANTPNQQKQDNFKKLKRDTKKYNLDEWTTPEKINKSVFPYLKRHTTETTQVVNTIYKITENTRFQARVAMEIYELLQLAFTTNNEETETIIKKCIEQSKRLAIFGLETARIQEREAREYADKALNIPNNIKHFENTEEDTKSRNAYSDEFLNTYHKAKFEQRLLQQVSTFRGGYRGNGHFQSRGNSRGLRVGIQQQQQQQYFSNNQQQQSKLPKQLVSNNQNSPNNYNIPTDGIAPGGRLQMFVPQWKKTTNHQWPLSVIQDGYQIPLIKNPILWRLRQIHLNSTEQMAANEAVEKFLQADIIELSPTQNTDFLSNFFTIQETNKRRPILDCQKINQYIQCQHFKMEGVPALRDIIETNDFICKLDLKDDFWDECQSTGVQQIDEVCNRTNEEIMDQTCLLPTRHLYPGHNKNRNDETYSSSNITFGKTRIPDKLSKKCINSITTARIPGLQGSGSDIISLSSELGCTNDLVPREQERTTIVARMDATEEWANDPEAQYKQRPPSYHSHTGFLDCFCTL